MKYDIAMAWVKDLRENQDKQGKLALKKGDQFCCLGRLCLVVGETFGHYDECCGELSVLPYQVMAKAEMRYKEGRLSIEAFPERYQKVPHHEGRAHGWLCEANDFGITFTEIADIIEQYWEEL